jgi:excinuclease UvrABC ATPase subunit
VVITGISGSGKSTLAFDTIYAEGQRRYVESLSAYARQFLEQMEKPRYDTIRGLSPTISIEQKTTGSNPRSTVGTITEIADYLRVLYARSGAALSPVRAPVHHRADRAGAVARDAAPAGPVLRTAKASTASCWPSARPASCGCGRREVVSES